MVELKFVGKCLLITVLLMFALQFDIGGKRGETYVANYLRNGTAVVWVRDSMKGAHLFIVRTTNEFAPKLKISQWMPSFGETKERNVSSDIQSSDFPEEEVGDGAQKASIF